MGVLIRQPGGQWHEPGTQGYDSEAALQHILHDHPSLVPGVSADAVACIEFQSGAGRADIVIVDSDGKLTLVECKLGANPQIRREVIGQVLDYASRIWRMDVEEFEQRWKQANGGLSPFEALSDDGAVRAAVAEHLASGHFNLVLAVDGLNDDVKRIVEFLNAVTLPETGVIVAEFAHAREAEVEILIPTSYGADLVEAKAAAPRTSGRTWTVEEYLKSCEDYDPASSKQVAELITAAKQAGFQIEGGKGASPSLNFGITADGIGLTWPLALFTYGSGLSKTAAVEVRFLYYRELDGLAPAIADSIEAQAGMVELVQEARRLDFKKRPNRPARDLTAEQLRALPRAVASVLRRP
ncbi:hypothetical protein SA2016_1259 [Sinomonas atrocyanea]|uniref:DUF91 domain-containing protein n=1 Tax=Sinomonas atrocyanea TaxID=37927 RepID=A0A126ZXQ1_9MICC|nr:hypothetical protein [Sinomonas atrocyanea]AMM31939.1 hypothetical protein SA2016_1259 [Sinomonas atrocyanea]GEB65974.1 hypothetical protein SAT01_34220 [Sinomonas atrocyanea]GGG65874.1 hypothetical protein GCM10007172_16710 [Sinomonas atrocyanea]